MSLLHRNDQKLHLGMLPCTMKIRADWYLGKSGLRGAWDRGDMSSFWPYGKSMKEVFAKSA